MLVEIHQRYHVGSNCGRSEVNGNFSRIVQKWRMFFVSRRRGGIEDDLKSFLLFEQAVDSFCSSCQTLLARSRQAFRIGNDAGHEHGAQKVTPLEFVHEVGADIAGTQDRYRCFLHNASSIEDHLMNTCGPTPNRHQVTIFHRAVAFTGHCATAMPMRPR